MAWSTPLTWTTNQVVTAAQLNSNIRDNMNQTAPAKATAAGNFFATSGVNTIAQRVPTAAYIGTTETTTSTSYANLATPGPDVSVVSGPQILIMLTAGMFNNTINAACNYGLAGVSPSATIFVGSDNEAVRHTSSTANAFIVGSWAYIYPVTSGTNIFRARYSVSAGTGSFFDRRLSAVPF